jgi:uncharacterized protein YhbP (UPF0306 family)
MEEDGVVQWILNGNDVGGGAGRLPDRQRRIHAFLCEHPVGVLSSVDPNGNPHGAVVYFTIDEHFVIRILTKKGTRKHDNLLHYNHVMLTVFDVSTQTTAQATGLAFERLDPATVAALTQHVQSLARQHGGSTLPIEQLQAGELTTFLVEPVQIRMAVYAPPNIGNHNQLFDTIETFSPT